MKIRPNADFCAIHVVPLIQQAKFDTPAMQAESARLILVLAGLDFHFVQDFPAKIFRNHGKQLNLKSGKTIT